MTKHKLRKSHVKRIGTEGAILFARTVLVWIFHKYVMPLLGF